MRKNPHVRICGGPGSATTLAYPTAFLSLEVQRPSLVQQAHVTASHSTNARVRSKRW